MNFQMCYLFSWLYRLHDVEQTHKAAINQLQQLEQQMALEKEQRSHLEDALAHTEELLRLREYRNSVNDVCIYCI